MAEDFTAAQGAPAEPLLAAARTSPTAATAPCRGCAAARKQALSSAGADARAADRGQATSAGGMIAALTARGRRSAYMNRCSPAFSPPRIT